MQLTLDPAVIDLLNDLLQQASPALLAAITVLAIPVAILYSSPRPPQTARRDPRRLFTMQQRRDGFERCGQRCEADSVLFIRCTRTATQGDHWFPHAKGGATTMPNFVGLCAVHNRRKSARIPTRFATARLTFRRRAYWQSNTPITPGEWFVG